MLYSPELAHDASSGTTAINALFFTTSISLSRAAFLDLYVEARDSEFTRSLGPVASKKSAPALMSTAAGKLNLMPRAKPCHLQALHYLSALHRPQD